MAKKLRGWLGATVRMRRTFRSQAADVSREQQEAATDLEPKSAEGAGSGAEGNKELNICKDLHPKTRCECVCVCACVRACVRGCVRACVGAWVRACVRACVGAWVRACVGYRCQVGLNGKPPICSTSIFKTTRIGIGSTSASQIL